MQFASRHGDGVTLWAVFERPGDEAVWALLHEPHSDPIDEHDPELGEALRIHRLHWSSTG